MVTDFVFLAFVIDRFEWTACCDEAASFRPLVDILRLGLVEFSWIAEGKDDGSFDMFGHFADDFFREGLRLGGRSDEDVGFDVLHD